MAQGRQEGMTQGRQEGAEQFLVDLITTKLKQGLDTTTIAKDLVQTQTRIEELIKQYNITNN